MPSGTLPPRSARSPAGQLVEYDRYIETQLRKTGAEVKGVDFAGASMTLVVGVLVYLFVAILADHWLLPGGLGFWGRVLACGGLVTGVVYYSVRRILPLLIRRINPVYAARAIERSKPSLKNSLINFLLLRSNRQAASESVFHAIEEQAAKSLSRTPIDSAVDRSQLIHLGYALTAIVVALALYKVLSPKDPLDTVARVVAPWANIQTPTRVEIVDIQPGQVTVYRGQSVAVSAEIVGLEGEEVTLFYTTVDQRFVDQAVPMRIEQGAYRHSCTLPETAGGIQQTLDYRIQAGDATSGAFRITVTEAPTILVEKLQYELPKYTELKPREVERQGDIEGIEGAQVTIHARANQPIAEAWLDFDCDGKVDQKLAAEGQTATASFRLALKEDRLTPVAASYQLIFTNAAGDKNPQPLTHKIEVIPDEAPEIEFLAPRKQEVDVPLNGRIDLELQARDPDFALAKVEFTAAHAKGPLISQSLLDAPFKGPLRRKFAFQPAKFNLKAGDIVEYWATAEDNKAPAPNRAQAPRSGPKYRIRILPASQRPQPQEQDQGAESQEDEQGADQDPAQDPREQPDQDAPQDEQAENPNEQQPQPNEEGAEGDPRNQKPDPRNRKERPNKGQQNNDQQGEQGGEGQEGEAGEQGGQEGGAQGEQGEGGDSGGDGAQGSQGGQGKSRSGPGKAGQDDEGRAFRDILDHQKQKQEQEQEKQQGEQSEEEQQPGSKSESGGDGQGADGASGQQPKTGDQPGATDRRPGQSGKQPQPGEQQPNEDPQQAGTEERSGEQQKPDGQEGASGQNETGERPRPDDQRPSGDAGQPGDSEEAANSGQQGKGRQSKPAGANGQESPDGGRGEEQPADRANGEDASEKPAGQGKEPAGGERGMGQRKGADGQGTKKPAGERGERGAPDGEEQPRDDAGQEQGTPGQPSDEASGEQPGAEQSERPSGTEGAEKGTGEQRSERPTQDGAGGTKPKPTRGAAPKGRPNDSGERMTGQEGAEKQGSEQDPAAGGSREGAAEEQDDPQEIAGKRPGKSEATEDNGGEAGAGEGSEQQGSPSDEEDAQGRPKQPRDDAGGESRDPADSAQSPAHGQKESASEGEQGDREGGGREGGGQQAEKPDPGEAGESTPTDRGAGKSTEPGQGESGDQAGDDARAEEKTGQAGTKRGEGSQQRPSGAGDNPGPEGEPGESERQNPDQGQPGKSQAGQPQGGGQPGDQGDIPPLESREPGEDEANLEYAKKATDLALEHLRNQLKDKPDQELLDKLGWSREELQRFTQRWEKLKRAAQTDDSAGQAAKNELEETLRSLGLREDTVVRSGDRTTDDASRGLDEESRFVPPPEYAEQFRAFKERTSGAGAP